VDIAKELQETQKRQKDIVGRIQQLEQERQQLIQEALRLDGEVRALTRLSKETKEE